MRRPLAKSSDVPDSPSPPSPSPLPVAASSVDLGGEVFVGLDPSWTGYGVSILRAGDVLVEHAEYLIKTKPSHSGRRAHHLLQQLLDALPDHADGIAIEGFNRGARNGREEAGASNIVTMMALVSKYGDTAVAVPTVVAPMTLKKFVTGSGKGDKNQMLKAVFQKWGADFDNDNLADAHSLARVAAAVRSGTSDLAYEREVLATLKKSEQTWVPPQGSSR